jgi:hypothetical protein
VRSDAVDRLEQCAKQLRRLLEHVRALVLEAVHQKAVAVIVVVEDPPQLLPGRQAPVPLQLGCNRRLVDGRDPTIFHSGNRILCWPSARCIKRDTKYGSQRQGTGTRLPWLAFRHGDQTR